MRRTGHADHRARGRFPVGLDDPRVAVGPVDNGYRGDLDRFVAGAAVGRVGENRRRSRSRCDEDDVVRRAQFPVVARIRAVDLDPLERELVGIRGHPDVVAGAGRLNPHPQNGVHGGVEIRVDGPGEEVNVHEGVVRREIEGETGAPVQRQIEIRPGRGIDSRDHPVDHLRAAHVPHRVAAGDIDTDPAQGELGRDIFVSSRHDLDPSVNGRLQGRVDIPVPGVLARVHQVVVRAQCGRDPNKIAAARVIDVRELVRARRDPLDRVDGSNVVERSGGRLLDEHARNREEEVGLVEHVREGRRLVDADPHLRQA